MTNSESKSTSRPAARREGGQGDGVEQVRDSGTTPVPADQVANAAAESLHGSSAVEEKYAQPDARSLPGGATLISDPKGDNPRAGERA